MARGKWILGMGMIVCGAAVCTGDTPATQPNQSLNVEEPAWPRRFQNADLELQLFQPQVDDWHDNKLNARAAVAVVSGKEKDVKPEYGIVWLTARTDVDKEHRVVALNEITITTASFPQHREDEERFKQFLNEVIPDVAKEVPLDHLEANLAVTQNVALASAVKVKNDAPKIFFATTPSLLVLIDGDPVLRGLEGTQLQRVINTRALILLDEPLQTYYLHAMNGWYSAPNATGPWERISAAPAAIEMAAGPLTENGQVDLLDPRVPEAAPKHPPAIVISVRPAELIQTEGDPQFTPIDGTKLLFIKNTDSAIFLDTVSQKYYALFSGRWFVTEKLDGDWASVDGKDLPADFSKIPPDSAKANVRVSVPGTEEASEAIVAASIPQTATVQISEAKLEVNYDGPPKFQEIDGAAGLAYAVNTSLPVVRIDKESSYWCVQDGVWFMSSESPMGPWTVATAIPPIIYTIPVTCPIHYVVYVRVYGKGDGVVYVGYTPGYMGAYVAPDGVVVYGTGYYYPAYVGTTWVGYPCTYGYGAGFACGAATGFAFGFAAGAIMGDCWPEPYWGPCWGYAHVDINTSNVYANWRGGVTTVRGHYTYDSVSGKSTADAFARTFNPYTGRASAGGYSNYFNRESGNYDLVRGGATYNRNTGVIAAGGREVTGNVYDGDIHVDRAGARINTRTDSGVAWHDGDVYAGHDGNIYRHTDDGWEKHTDDGWQKPARDQDFTHQRQDLDRERHARDIGHERTSAYHRNGGFGGGGRPSGIRHFGGGGFRGRR